MIRKLRPDAVRWGKHFCIALMDTGSLIEIEGKHVKGEYTVSLLHQPAYTKTYTEYGTEGTIQEWQAATALLRSYTAGLCNNAKLLTEEKELINQ